MLCPLKFSHYEFEGGQDCIGSECGMFKRCNADYEITAVEFDTLDEHAQALERENAELRKKVDELTAELERETLISCNTCAARIDLEHQVDELINAVNELQIKQPYCCDPDKPVDTLDIVGRYIDELTTELTAARNAHAQAEHEAVILREKLGRMLDCSHEITRIGGDVTP